MKFSRFTHGDVDYHVSEAGECDGPAILLLAGLASDGRSWQPIQSALGNQFRLIMPDNRGTGRTLPHNAPINFLAMVDDYAALLDHYELGPCIVLGHSMGASMALDLAARYPALVSRLILAAGSPTMPDHMKHLMGDLASLRRDDKNIERWYRLLFQWLFAPSFFADERTVMAAAQMSVAMPDGQSAEQFSAQVDALTKADLTSAIAKVTCPTLVLNGEFDRFFHGFHEVKSFSDIAHSQIKILTNAGHSLHWDQPEAFVNAVMAFLRDESG